MCEILFRSVYVVSLLFIETPGCGPVSSVLEALVISLEVELIQCTILGMKFVLSRTSAMLCDFRQQCLAQG
jgi:hypothetical protein